MFSKKVEQHGPCLVEVWTVWVKFALYTYTLIIDKTGGKDRLSMLFNM